MLSRTLCEVRAGGPVRAGPTLPPTSHNVTAHGRFLSHSMIADLSSSPYALPIIRLAAAFSTAFCLDFELILA